MLLSREYVISGIRKLQPTYDSLNVMVEYILLFPDELETILEIIVKESAASNAYTNLFILYLLNELLGKQSQTQEKSINRTTRAIKDVLRIGKKKADFIAQNSTEGLKKSALILKSKYAEIEKLLGKSKETQEQGNNLQTETYLDVEYLESLCKKKDKKSILKYIKELKKIVDQH